MVISLPISLMSPTLTLSLAAGKLSSGVNERHHISSVCSVHPHRPLLATASGQRHFPLPAVDDNEDGEEETLQDNSLKVWSLLPLPPPADDDS